MPSQIGPKFFKDFSAGMVTNLSTNIAPQNSVSLAVNMDFDDEIGAATSRPGTTIVGSQLVDNMTILGLHQHIDTATPANNILFATINASGGATSVIKDVSDGSSDVAGLTASAKMRYLTYLGATLAINGADAERSYTQAGGWITTGGAFDLANIPGSNTCNLCLEFLDRVYLAGDNSEPTRLYYSSVPVSGAISWTAGDGYVDIEPEDGGGPITALGKVPGYILIFKERSLHRWNYDSAFPETLIQIGTPSQESVVMGGGLCAFYSNSNENAKGFYITDGGRPRPISHDNTRPIKKFIDAISASYEDDIAGYATDSEFAWSIGDVTVDGETYTNVVVRFNYKLNQWSIRSYPSQFSVFANYLVSGVNTIVGGDDDGTIYRINKSGTYSDNTTPIKWLLRTQHNHWNYNQLKRLSDKVVVRGLQLLGISTTAFVNEVLDPIPLSQPNKWRSFLSLFGLGKSIEGTSIAIQVSGETLNHKAIVREIELPKLEVQDSYE